MPRAFPCPACGARIMTFLRAGEKVECPGCYVSAAVPETADEVSAEPEVVSPRPSPATQPPRRRRSRLTRFDKLCASLAFLLGLFFLIQGVAGIFWPVNANFSLSAGLGVIPAFVGWGILRSIWVAWRCPASQSAAELSEVFE